MELFCTVIVVVVTVICTSFNIHRSASFLPQVSFCAWLKTNLRTSGPTAQSLLSCCLYETAHISLCLASHITLPLSAFPRSALFPGSSCTVHHASFWELQDTWGGCGSCSQGLCDQGWETGTRTDHYPVVQDMQGYDVSLQCLLSLINTSTALTVWWFFYEGHTSAFFLHFQSHQLPKVTKK